MIRASTYLSRIQKELDGSCGSHFAPFGHNALGLILGLWNDHPGYIPDTLEQWAPLIEAGSQPGWHEQNSTLWSMLLSLQDKGHPLDKSIDRFLALAHADCLSVGGALLEGGNTGGYRSAHILQSADRQHDWLERQGKANLFPIMVTATGYRILSEAMGSNDLHTSQSLMDLFETHVPAGLAIQSWNKDKPLARPIHHWTSIALERSNTPHREYVLDRLLARGEDLNTSFEGKTPLERVVEEEARRSLEQQRDMMAELAQRGATLPEYVEGRARETWEQHPAGRRKRLEDFQATPAAKPPGPGMKM